MLAGINPSDRAIIEAIRDAKSVRIVINEGLDDKKVLLFNNRDGFKSFCHELRLVVQNYIKQLNNI